MGSDVCRREWRNTSSTSLPVCQLAALGVVEQILTGQPTYCTMSAGNLDTCLEKKDTVVQEPCELVNFPY
jgi:hypothetical protein